jgi:hypothetical protein
MSMITPPYHEHARIGYLRLRSCLLADLAKVWMTGFTTSTRSTEGPSACPRPGFVVAVVAHASLPNDQVLILVNDTYEAAYTPLPTDPADGPDPVMYCPGWIRLGRVVVIVVCNSTSATEVPWVGQTITGQFESLVGACRGVDRVLIVDSDDATLGTHHTWQWTPCRREHVYTGGLATHGIRCALIAWAVANAFVPHKVDTMGDVLWITSLSTKQTRALYWSTRTVCLFRHLWHTTGVRGHRAAYIHLKLVRVTTPLQAEGLGDMVDQINQSTGPSCYIEVTTAKVLAASRQLRWSATPLRRRRRLLLSQDTHCAKVKQSFPAFMTDRWALACTVACLCAKRRQWVVQASLPAGKRGYRPQHAFSIVSWVGVARYLEATLECPRHSMPDEGFASAWGLTPPGSPVTTTDRPTPRSPRHHPHGSHPGRTFSTEWSARRRERVPANHRGLGIRSCREPKPSGPTRQPQSTIDAPGIYGDPLRSCGWACPHDHHGQQSSPPDAGALAGPDNIGNVDSSVHNSICRCGFWAAAVAEKARGRYTGDMGMSPGHDGYSAPLHVAKIPAHEYLASGSAGRAMKTLLVL